MKQTLQCIIYTEKYIDKMIKPLEKYSGIVKELKQTCIEKDFMEMKTAYFTTIEFPDAKCMSKFISYIRQKTSKKYDFFLELI